MVCCCRYSSILFLVRNKDSNDEALCPVWSAKHICCIAAIAKPDKIYCMIYIYYFDRGTGTHIDENSHTGVLGTLCYEHITPALYKRTLTHPRCTYALYAQRNANTRSICAQKIQLSHFK